MKYFDLCHVVTVMRDGHVIDTKPIGGADS